MLYDSLAHPHHMHFLLPGSNRESNEIYIIYNLCIKLYSRENLRQIEMVEDAKIVSRVGWDWKIGTRAVMSISNAVTTSCQPSCAHLQWKKQRKRAATTFL